MPPTDSPFETKLYQVLRGYGLPRPQRQFWIYDGDSKLGSVDFAYPEQMTVIEADSYKHHSSRLDWDSDIDRYNTLTSLGWAVLRVTWRRLRDRPEEVMRKIARTIGYGGLDI